MVKAKRKLLANILAHFSWYTMIALVIGSFVLKGEETINFPKLALGTTLTFIWIFIAVLVEPDDGLLKEEEADE
jgi:hypothetical protein